MSVTGPDGEAVELKGERLRTLLAALVLSDGRPVPVGVLTDTLWPDEPPANPANAVQALASRLRSALGRDAVELTPAGYRLTLGTDLAAFAESLRAEEYGRALALWRGAPDLPGHPEEVARLLAQRQSARDEVVDTELAAGRGAAQIAALRASVAADPLRERSRAQLLRALHQAGRDAEALAEYERARTLLAEELGTGPSPLLCAAHLAVLTSPAALPAESTDAAGAAGPGTASSGTTPAHPAGTSAAESGPADTGTTPAHPAGTRAAGPGTASSGTTPAHPAGTSAAESGPAGTGTTPAHPAGTSAAESGPAGTGTAPADTAGAAPGDFGSPASGSARSAGAASGVAGFSPPVPHGLPAALTSFLGREAEVTAVREALGSARLVTLIGPGGAGKTRLAIESARSHPTPLRLVELAPVGEGADVPSAVAATLHRREAAPTRPVPGGGNPVDTTERLIDSIGTTDLLLLLDNCEHLIDAAATLAARLLAACPQLRVLATSREPLAITGEQLLPVPPLALPEPDAADAAGAEGTCDYPAVRLFLDRAAAVRPDWTPTADELATVVTVCRALDGQPLAIELAAARMRSLDPQGIADRLAQRFRLLTGGSRAALPRHRTLRAVVDWSWDLLEAPERALLARLSVFSGPAALVAVEEICATASPELTEDQIFDVLASLVDKSLVVRTDAGRYRLLETIRVYAAERLAEEGATAATRGAHAAHFLALAERHETDLYGRRQVAALAAFSAAHDDLIAALRWCVEHDDPDTAIRLVAGIGWYLWRRGEQGENLPLVHQALALPTEGVPPLAHAVAAGITALYAVDTDWQLDSTLDLLHRAIRLRDALADPVAHPVLPLLDIMTALFEQQDWDVTGLAVRLLDVPHPWVRAAGRLFYGFSLQNEGRAEEAEATLREAAEQFHEVGDLWGQSFCCSGLADYALWRGDVDDAVALWERAVEFEQRMGVNADAPDYRARMIAARYAAAESEEAVTELEQLVVSVRAGGSWSPLLVAHSALAGAYRRTAVPERGLMLLEEALGLVDNRLHGLPQMKSLLLTELGLSLGACGRLDEAERAHLDALRNAGQSYDGPIVAAALQGCAGATRRAPPTCSARPTASVASRTAPTPRWPPTARRPGPPSARQPSTPPRPEAARPHARRSWRPSAWATSIPPASAPPPGHPEHPRNAAPRPRAGAEGPRPERLDLEGPEPETAGARRSGPEGQGQRVRAARRRGLLRLGGGGHRLEGAVQGIERHAPGGVHRAAEPEAAGRLQGDPPVERAAQEPDGVHLRDSVQRVAAQQRGARRDHAVAALAVHGQLRRRVAAGVAEGEAPVRVREGDQRVASAAPGHRLPQRVGQLRHGQRRDPLPQLRQVPQVRIQARVRDAEAARHRRDRQPVEAGLVGEVRRRVGDPVRGQAHSCQEHSKLQ
ncbi:putative ATPase/DNA-binding SARP family transcriptional activator [Streptacidiphilus sp. MAP12-33]